MNPHEAQTGTLAENAAAETSAEVLATLAEIGEEVNASLDLDEVLARSAALIKRHIDYEIFGVLMFDGDGSYLRHRFSIGYPRDLAANLRIPLGQGITGTAAATGHPVRVGDTHHDSRYIHAVDDVRSELAVPLMLRGKCIGVLDIQSRHPEYFTREQQNILTLLASRLAVAVENARLFERVRAQADTLLLLNEVGRETSSILDVEELLRRAAEQTKRVIDYQILSIMLYDEEQKVFRHRVDVKHGQRVQGKLRAAASEGIVGAAATLKEPVLVPDVTADPRYIMANPETRSELAIPMMHKGRVIGVLDLESPQLNYFTDDHVQTLSILAANFAVSLENARLYEQVARDEARLDRDLAGGETYSGRTAALGAERRLRLGHGGAVYFGARAWRRPLRIFALWAAPVGRGAGRRERQGHCGGAVWRGGDRNYAQSCAAETAAVGNAAADESDYRRAAHRRTLHDGVLCELAEGAQQTAGRERGAVAAAAI